MRVFWQTPARTIVAACGVLFLMALCGCSHVVNALIQPQSPSIREVRVDLANAVVSVHTRYSPSFLLKKNASRITGWYTLPDELESVKHTIFFVNDSLGSGDGGDQWHEFRIAGFQETGHIRPAETSYYFKITEIAYFDTGEPWLEETATVEVWKYRNGTLQCVSPET